MESKSFTVTVDIPLEEGAWMENRNGVPYITFAEVWCSPDQNCVQIGAAGKANRLLRGGISMPATKFEELCLKYLSRYIEVRKG